MTKREEEEDSEQKNEKTKEIIKKILIEAPNNNNNNKTGYHYFRLFSYMSMALIAIAILVGLVFLFQHNNLVANQSTVLKNQEFLIKLIHGLDANSQKALENQGLLKTLLNQVRSHEQREESELFNNTSTNINISSSNSERLDKIIEFLKIK